MAKRVYYWITDAGYEALAYGGTTSVDEWTTHDVDDPVRFRVGLPVTPTQHTEMEADQVLRPSIHVEPIDRRAYDQAIYESLRSSLYD